MKLFQAKFRNAFRGLYHIFRDLGVRIQLVLMIVVLIFFSFFNLTLQEWILIVLCCGAVVIAEMINCAIECIMNFIEPNYNKEVGKIKDISAGMVLFTCFVSAFIGVLIVWGKLS